MGEAIDVVRSVDPVADEWDRLADVVDAPPFHRPGWIAIWWAVFGTGDLEVFTLRRDGDLAAVLPLVLRRGVRRATTNEHTPESCLVATDGAAALSLARAVFARRQHRVSLALLDPARPGLAESRQAAEEARYRVEVATLQRSPYVVVAGDWGEYERALGANLRKDIRRRRRRLEEVGEATVQVTDGRGGLESLLDEGFGVEAANWKGREGTAISSAERTLRFYTEVARWAADRGWLRLSFLRLDGHPIAFDYSLEHGTVFSCVKGGYDESYDRFSPGKLLSHALLERAFARGLTRFDLLGADEAYKQAWTGASRDMQLLRAFAPSVPGTLGWAASIYAPPVRDRIREVLRSAARAARPRMP